jgi:DNA-binding NtrC family response regulator
VRELKNVIERACMLTDGNVISERELAGAFGPDTPGTARPRAVETTIPRVNGNGSGTTPLGELERDHIVEVLGQVRGNRMAAAKLLGISRRALYRRLERHHIEDERTIARRVANE